MTEPKEFYPELIKLLHTDKDVICRIVEEDEDTITITQGLHVIWVSFPDEARGFHINPWPCFTIPGAELVLKKEHILTRSERISSDILQYYFKYINNMEAKSVIDSINQSMESDKDALITHFPESVLQ